MGGGGGGSADVRETAAQKAAAEVARKQWDMYQKELKPFENLFMEKVDELNTGAEYERLSGEVGLGYAGAFGEAREQAGTELAAAGVDPTSGKYQSAMDDLTGDQMVGQADAVARTQTSQQDKYVAGLKDIAAIGSGQKAEAVQGYQNLSDMAHRKAMSEAEAAHQRNLSDRAATAGAVGSLIGAGAGYGLNKVGGMPESVVANQQIGASAIASDLGATGVNASPGLSGLKPGSWSGNLYSMKG